MAVWDQLSVGAGDVRAGEVIMRWPEGPTTPGVDGHLGQNRGIPLFSALAEVHSAVKFTKGA